MYFVKIKKLLQSYYHLTKPGIVYGNDISLVAGFLLASKTVGLDYWLLLATLLGVSLVIASACVFNNYIDKDIDVYMKRTKQRALVQKQISEVAAIVYASILGITGFIFLIIFTNWLTVVVGLIGYVDYIVFYGIAKRKSVLGTVIGSVAGSMPIVAGYTAVSNSLDTAAWLLFFAMVFWQMPHFYAIAIRRIGEYKKAKLPVLPVKKGIETTKIQIILYIILFCLAASLLTIYGYTSWQYLGVMLITSIYWLGLGMIGFSTTDNNAWAKKVFLFSLAIMIIFSLSLIVDSLAYGKIV